MRFLSILLLFTLFSGCVMQDMYKGIAPGVWRGVLFLEGKESVKLKTSTRDYTGEVAEEKGQLPFNFEVKYDDKGKFYMEIINGEERIRVDDIEYGRDRFKNRRDTMMARLPIFGSILQTVVEEKVMEGTWTKGGVSVKFIAKHAQSYRFTELNKTPTADITGKWDVVFGLDQPEKDREVAIGEFVQKGNHLTGTFMTETGDYRFLEGTVQKNKAYLSCFDGSHAFLFEAKILEDGTLAGGFWSGKTYKTTWSGKRNPTATLRAADALTFLKPGQTALGFNFTNTDGKKITLQDETLKGKTKIVQIFGSWCPNCLDETRFLIDFIKNKPNIAVLGLGFEKAHTATERMTLLKNYKKSLNIPYDLFDGGYASKDTAAAALPQLNHIMSFPTTIIIDKNNKVRKIYTGFSGPATSEYAKFKTEFEAFLKSVE
jgi:thiol-disulfide isomerase/thioredoxin